MERPDSPYPELDEARAVRSRTLQLLEGLSQAQVDFSPPGKTWSLGQNADHLLKSAELYRAHFQTLVARKKAGKTPFVYRGLSNFIPAPKALRPLLPLFELPFALPNSLFPGAARRGFMTGRKIPLKAPKTFEPSVGRPVDELRADLRAWIDELDRLEGEGVDLDKLYFYNSIVGLVTLPGAVDFLTSHEKRHHQQMAELLARDDFPAA